MNKKTGLMMRAIVVCLGVFVATASANAQQCPATPTLKIDTHTLDFSEKKPVCVRANGTFRIKLKAQNNYPLDYADVTVRQKSGWTKIKKLGVDGQGVMTVEVGGFQVGADPKYKIKVKDVGVLDPRVRIIPSFLSDTLALDDIESQLLEDFGLSLSGLLEIDQLLQEEYTTSISDILASIRAQDGEYQE